MSYIISLKNSKKINEFNLEKMPPTNQKDTIHTIKNKKLNGKYTMI